MTRPRRIQRQRTKGWRMPEGAVYVGRPSRWGNIVRVGECAPCGYGENHHGIPHANWTAFGAVRFFRDYIRSQPSRDLEPLRGKDLACWCPLDQPCHADVLLELANR